MDNTSLSRETRSDLEIAAIESARSEMQYLGFGPQTDTWRHHCRTFGSKLDDALRRYEFWAANPDYKLG